VVDGVIQLWIPMPPSVNNLFVNVPKRGRVPSKRYTDWRVAAGKVLNTQQYTRLEGPVTIEYGVGTDTRADISNLEKAATDLLVSSGVIDGDSRKTLKKLVMYWSPEAHEGINVTVRRFE